MVPVARESLLQRRQGPPVPPALRVEVGERHPGEGGSRRGAPPGDEEPRRDCSQTDRGPRWSGSEI